MGEKTEKTYGFIMDRMKMNCRQTPILNGLYLSNNRIRRIGIISHTAYKCSKTLASKEPLSIFDFDLIRLKCILYCLKLMESSLLSFLIF